jgi:hypothetical protein
MLNEIDLQITGRRIVPVSKGPDWYSTVDCIAHSAGASALATEGLFAHIP